MGHDKIRYLLPVSGRWRWRPTKAMRKLGFKLVSFGTELTPADKERAIRLNEEWDKVRTGAQPSPEKVFPAGSVGDGYQRAIALRAAERAAKGIVWTKEQESRDDWPRAWKWLEPLCGDLSPRSMQPEHMLTLRTKVAKKVSDSEAHRVIKVWRALWKKMSAMGYCDRDADPSLLFANSAPDPRSAVWLHAEVAKLVPAAWDMGYCGLAALMAVAWDSMLSPIDARRLTPGQKSQDRDGVFFFLERAKTGRAAAGTLTPWSEQLLTAYLATLGAELHAAAPIFRTPGTEPGPKGGRRWLPQPYRKDTLGDHFRIVRTKVFGLTEERLLSDMRRSGAVEGDAGGASLSDQANKMANSIDTNRALRKTYNPVNVSSVRSFDEARARGRTKLKE